MKWNKIEDGLPPVGIPIIVTIKQEWEKNPKVVGPVYYQKSHYDGTYGFYEYGIGTEDRRIGPTSVEVTHWTKWPDPHPCEEIRG